MWYFFALERHIFFQYTPTTLQPVLKCGQIYAGQSTNGVHEQNGVSEISTVKLHVIMNVNNIDVLTNLALFTKNTMSIL